MLVTRWRHPCKVVACIVQPHLYYNIIIMDAYHCTSYYIIIIMGTKNKTLSNFGQHNSRHLSPYCDMQKLLHVHLKRVVHVCMDAYTQEWTCTCSGYCTIHDIMQIWTYPVGRRYLYQSDGSKLTGYMVRVRSKDVTPAARNTTLASSKILAEEPVSK